MLNCSRMWRRLSWASSDLANSRELASGGKLADFPSRRAVAKVSRDMVMVLMVEDFRETTTTNVRS